MKTQLTLLWGALFLALPFLVSSQPTLTYPGTPPNGTQYTAQLLSNPASFTVSSGANQTWDYSNLTVDTSLLFQLQDPSSVPAATSFPAATYASQTFDADGNGSVTFTFYESNSDSLANLGFTSLQMDQQTQMLVRVTYVHSNPEVLFRYPLSYNDLSADTFVTTSNVVNGLYTQRTGSNEMAYVGYGTLQVPGATYNNVIKLTFTQTYSDSSFLDSTTGFSLFSYEAVNHYWYQPGEFTPLLALSSLTIDNGFSANTFNFTLSYPRQAASLKNFEIAQLKVFPQPASDVLYASFESQSAGKLVGELYDLNGRKLMRVLDQWTTASEQELQFSVNNLNPGVYLLKLTKGTSVVYKKIEIK
ncbi:MAG: T9SS type A sorting domain-containing protein [Bacteroidia bacterium]|nr:T9SS type A sorting domain-containing protein [Bacteroidia bacterium]